MIDKSLPSMSNRWFCRAETSAGEFRFDPIQFAACPWSSNGYTYVMGSDDSLSNVEKEIQSQKPFSGIVFTVFTTH
jgi:hypothetical protein